MLLRELALACLILRNATNSTEGIWNVTMNSSRPSRPGDVPTWSIGDTVFTALPLLNSTLSFQPSTLPPLEIKNETEIPTLNTTTANPSPQNTTSIPQNITTERPTKFFDENNTNPYPGYTLPTNESVFRTEIIPTETIQTDIPSSSSPSIAVKPEVYITLISVIIACLFFFISS